MGSGCLIFSMAAQISPANDLSKTTVKYFAIARPIDLGTEASDLDGIFSIEQNVYGRNFMCCLRSKTHKSREGKQVNKLFIGGPCRIRTYDQRIKSPMLYQLS